MFDLTGLISAINKLKDAVSSGSNFVATNHYVFAESETPTGTINGANTVFTLAHTPAVASSLYVFLNQGFQTNEGEDYTLVGDTITFVNAPLTGGVLRVFYKY